MSVVVRPPDLYLAVCPNMSRVGRESAISVELTVDRPTLLKILAAAIRTPDDEPIMLGRFRAYVDTTIARTIRRANRDYRLDSGEFNDIEAGTHDDHTRDP